MPAPKTPLTPLGRARRKAKLTQAQLAERAGISQAHLSNLEIGKNEPAGLQTALALADALGVDVRKLWPALAPNRRKTSK
jgi:transcriptional regulator with XRE-family HTH domain